MSSTPQQESGNMYFVSSRWRNNTHVSPMRLFSNLDAARKYAGTLTGGEAVIYELFPDIDKEPVKVPVKPKP